MYIVAGRSIDYHLEIKNDEPAPDVRMAPVGGKLFASIGCHTQAQTDCFADLGQLKLAADNDKRTTYTVSFVAAGKPEYKDAVAIELLPVAR